MATCKSLRFFKTAQKVLEDAGKEDRRFIWNKWLIG